MKNHITVEGNSAYIALSQGYVAIINAADVDLVAQYRWYAQVNRGTDGSTTRIYARAKPSIDGKRTTILLHRLITNAPGDLDVDHADHDGLNNRRSNLRVCTRSENNCNQSLSTANSSGYKGVSWFKPKQRWRAYITFNHKWKHLGYYRTKEEAAQAYDTAAIALHGEYALLNAQAV